MASSQVEHFAESQGLTLNFIEKQRGIDRLIENLSFFFFTIYLVEYFIENL